MSEPREENIYQSSGQHLTDELARLDLLLQLAILKMRKSLPAAPQEAFKGIFLSHQEIDHMLAGNQADAEQQTEGLENDAQIDDLLRAWELLGQKISNKKKASLGQGVHLTLPRLSQLFGLDPFEEQCVLICLAPELERKYGKIYAYLQDDITRKMPTVGLILDLLCSSREERSSARARFPAHAPLFKSQILSIIEDPRISQPPLLSRCLKLDDRIVNFLLKVKSLDERVASPSELLYPKLLESETLFDQETKTLLLALTRNHLARGDQQRNTLVFYLYGPYGAGRQTVAESICAELEVPLLVCDVEDLMARGLAFENTMRLIFREALLQPAAIYLKNFQRLLDDEERHPGHLKTLSRAIDEFAWLTFLAAEKNWFPRTFFCRILYVNREVPVPAYDDREKIWRTVGKETGKISQDVDFGVLANKFRFTGGQIQDALGAAQTLARFRQENDSEITLQDLYQGCRSQCNQKLSTLAQKISPKYTWADIVLPSDTLLQLQSIRDQVKYRHKVYGEWGFGRKLSLGKGLNALFSGSSGTGKTMAAEIIANELQLDLYKIDLSNVVSKYIGETEKNLSKIFDEAESSNAILFFDEADALFGKRSEVKDAHDRYANIEISYLLQKMEEYEGISILATNLKQNMDDAFKRRLHFLVEFPFPDESHRFRIWKTIFPEDAPVSEDLDFDTISTRLKIAGGNIKNIALNAAFLAAGDSGAINMNHIIQATRQEYQKIGRPYATSDFGKYASLLPAKEM